MKHFQLNDIIYYISHSSKNFPKITSGKITQIILALKNESIIEGHYHVNDTLISHYDAFSSPVEILEQLNKSLNTNPPSILI